MFTSLQMARTLWRVGLLRAQKAKDGGLDRGATALEWAVISAILVTAAVLVGGIVYTVVQNKGEALNECGSVTVGAGTTC
jgi:Flp pilus assembly pilin Flp